MGQVSRLRSLPICSQARQKLSLKREATTNQFYCFCLCTCIGVCVCVWVGIFTYVGSHTHLHTCGCWKPMLSVFHYVSLPYSFQAGTLTEPEAHWLARSSGQWSPGVCPSLLHSTGGTEGRRLEAYIWLFVWLLGIWTQVLVFVWQAHYLQS